MSQQGNETNQEAPAMPSQRPSGSAGDLDGSLSLAEAAQQYEASIATLRRRAGYGDLHAWQVHGTRGLEWRVSAQALRDAGYRPRTIDLTQAEVPAAAEVANLKAALAAERTRVTELDQRLGYALLTVGRLRGRLREAGIDPDGLFGGDLEYLGTPDPDTVG